MKSIIAIAVVLAGVLATTPLAYADESETDTEQKLKQENIESGASNNFNCGTNNIDSVAALIICADIGIVDDES